MGSMYKSRMPYIGMPVKCKHPGWESKIGAICAIKGDIVMVEFGKHELGEFNSEDNYVLFFIACIAVHDNDVMQFHNKGWSSIHDGNRVDICNVYFVCYTCSDNRHGVT